jgi:hypothetical protein
MAYKQVYALLSNTAATGPLTSVGGGFYAFQVMGTFNGATIKLQIQGPDGSTMQDIDSSLSFTAAGIQGVDLPTGAKVQAVVSGGPPSAMYANLSLVRS